MPDEQKTVFISYRRSVAPFIARSIFLDLRANDYDVFMDVESINSGTFDTIILNQIEARAHFVLILTPGTLERCAEPGDWLRREIEYAMEKGRNIVPLFVNEFKYDEAAKKFLTGDLAELPRLNGLNVPHDYFDEAMARLRTRFLKQPVSGIIKPTPPTETKIVAEKIVEAAAQPEPTKEELSAEEYFMMAVSLSDNSDQEISHYTEAIRLNSQYSAAYNNRGNAYFAQGNLKQALEDYNEALRIDPIDNTTYSNRGEAYFVLGEFDNAIADFQQTLTSDSTHSWALAGLAITLNERLETAKAKRTWRKLITRDARYRDADWVGKKLNWRPELVEAARKLIATL